MTERSLSAIRATHTERVATSWLPPQTALPQLSETTAFELLDRLIEAEQQIVAPGGVSEDYAIGTALMPDELFIAEGTRLIVSAEHATTQQRTKKKTPGTFLKEPDYGTAGLGYTLHEDLGATVIVPRGMQTGDANNDPDHPLKEALSGFIKNGNSKLHASLHGARTGLYQAFNDARGIDIHIGVGAEPTEVTTEYADRLVAKARDLGLRAIVNGSFVVNDSFEPLTPRISADGTPVLRSFAAKNPATTRAHVQAVAAQHGVDMATMQLELSGFLRLQPEDIDPRDKSARAMGVYLGYMVVRDTFQE